MKSPLGRKSAKRRSLADGNQANMRIVGAYLKPLDKTPKTEIPKKS